MARIKLLPLPPPRTRGSMSLEETLCLRRSVRSYRDEPLAEEDLGQLLWAAQGVIEHDERMQRRTAPSAGACYPLAAYAATAEWLARYDATKHALRVLVPRDVRPDLEHAALGQSFLRQAPLTLLLTGVARRIEERYGKSCGARYLAMEAGHAAQNVMLQAVALGLASVPVGAFEDAQVAQVLRLGPEEHPLYLLAVGHPA